MRSEGGGNAKVFCAQSIHVGATGLSLSKGLIHICETITRRQNLFCYTYAFFTFCRFHENC